MTGLDTNVLIRYLVQDDRKQSALASGFIEKFCDKTGTLFISQIVLCEVDWVLKRAYNLPRKKRLKVLREIIETLEFSVENSDIVEESLETCEESNLEFPDTLIGLTGLHHGCDYTVTFDRKAAKSKSFRLLQ